MCLYAHGPVIVADVPVDGACAEPVTVAGACGMQPAASARSATCMRALRPAQSSVAVRLCART